MRNTGLCMLLLLSLSVCGQKKHVAPVHEWKKHVPDTVQLRRWEFTFNALGLLEAPGAVGAGVGFHVNKRVELWSESAWLADVLAKRGIAGGIRQLFQVRYYPPQLRSYFIGVEARYKSVIVYEEDDFINYAAHDTLSGYTNRTSCVFFGMALLIGLRSHIGRSKHWQLEGTIGLGYKNACTSYQHVPPGYEHTILPEHWKIDTPVHFNRIVGSYTGPYFPWAFRIVYTLGRKL